MRCSFTNLTGFSTNRMRDNVKVNRTGPAEYIEINDMSMKCYYIIKDSTENLKKIDASVCIYSCKKLFIAFLQFNLQ